ncbi:acetamidase/formamidase family protein [Shouchella sp. 1P09AA]|uniref:acetamidase/formamidase family protein n=1 Tax=unclassified Shouchella TaxID=2893065 RepID=UPI0039A2EF9B
MKLNTNDYLYAFSDEAQIAASIHSGESITIETLDAFSNQIQDRDSIFQEIDMNAVNPATGAIYVHEAEVGDTLKVEVLTIELAKQGVMAVAPNLGVVGDEVEAFVSKIMKVTEQGVIFNDSITLPLRKMIGVIGVAPEGKAISCGTPGSHGGNMDNTMVTEGATLYLPVSCKGARFALGDVHAAMGDGEVCVTGVEIPAEVTVRLSVVKNTIKTPWLENRESIQVIASATTLEEAIHDATKTWADDLVAKTMLSFDESMMLLSACADVQICQVVNPLKTVRMVMRKEILVQAGYLEVNDASWTANPKRVV